jgi:hypothetical protein
MAVDSQDSTCEDTETQETLPREGTLAIVPQEETLHSLETVPPEEYADPCKFHGACVLGVEYDSPNGAREISKKYRCSRDFKFALLSHLPDALLNLVYSFAPHSVLLHLNTCKRFNDVLPQSDKVALGHRDFFGDPRHANRLHRQIQRFSGFLQLRLCDPGGLLLRKVRHARACWRVEALDLTSSKIGRIDAGEGGPSVPFAPRLSRLKCLKEMPVLHRLELRDNEMGDHGCEVLAPVLAGCTRLTHLGLGGNQIGDKGAVHLSLWLRLAANSKSLDLHDNLITDEGLVGLCKAVNEAEARTAKEVSTVRDFGAASEMCHVPGVQACLECLDLSRNQIRFDTDLIKFPSSLRCLSLRDNAVSATSAENLLIALERALEAPAREACVRPLVLDVRKTFIDESKYSIFHDKQRFPHIRLKGSDSLSTVQSGNAEACEASFISQHKDADMQDAGGVGATQHQSAGGGTHQSADGGADKASAEGGGRAEQARGESGGAAGGVGGEGTGGEEGGDSDPAAAAAGQGAEAGGKGGFVILKSQSLQFTDAEKKVKFDGDCIPAHVLRQRIQKIKPQLQAAELRQLELRDESSHERDNFVSGATVLVERAGLDIAAQAGSTDKLNPGQEAAKQIADANAIDEVIDDSVEKDLKALEKELGKLSASEARDFGFKVYDYMRKVVKKCKRVCPNFDIDDLCGKFALVVTASLKKLQIGKEQYKKAIVFVNEQWEKGGGQKKVCACTCVACDCVCVCSCVYLCTCTMSECVHMSVRTHSLSHISTRTHAHTHTHTHTQIFDDPEEEAELYAKVEQTQQQQPPLHYPQPQPQQQQLQPPQLPQPPQQPQAAAQAAARDAVAPRHPAPSSAANAAMQQPPQPLAAAAGGEETAERDEEEEEKEMAEEEGGGGSDKSSRQVC